MDKNRKTSHILNIFQYDADGHVVLPASLTLSIAPGAADNNSKVPTTAWVRTYVSGLAYATQSYVNTQVANLVASSPATLDTLNELAAALGNDPNFATTVATSIGTKQAQLNGTGFVKVTGTTVSYDNSTYLTTSSAASTYQTILTNPITGTGTTQTLAKFTSTGSTIGNSNIVLSSGANFVEMTVGSTSGSVNNYNTLSLLAVTEPRIYLTASDGFNSVLFNSYGNIGFQAQFSNPSVNNFIFYYNGYSSTNKSLVFQTSGLDRLTLNQNGSVRLNNYTTNGFVKFSGSDGTLIVDTNTYLTTSSASSTYLPLSGGTLTGPLIGTSATFNHNDAPTIRIQRNGGTDTNTVLEFTNASRSFYIGSNGTVMGLGGTSGSITGQPLQITSTGAATFSSSVQSKVNNILTDGVGVVLQGYVDNTLRIAVRGSGYNDGARGGLLASTGDFSSTLSVTGDSTFTGVVNFNNEVRAGAYALSSLNYIDGTAVPLSTRRFRASQSRTNNDNGAVGLDLTNLQSTNGVYSPIISFSSTTSGGVYNCTYAAIWGVKTADEGSWASGDLIFGTANPYGVTQRLRITAAGAATFSSSITTSGNINVNSDGIFINRSTSGEPYIFFRKDSVNRASIYGVTGGGLRIFDESDNQVLTITGTRLGISDPSPSRKLTVNFGTSVNDGLMVYGSQRLNTVFQSTGEHCFIYMDSNHANTFLPRLHLQRSSTTYGVVGLERASNSDGIGAYAESEMVVGTTTTVPFSIQTNSQRRIRVASGGGVEIFNTLSVSGNLTARNFSKFIKTWAPSGGTGSYTTNTYNWADELASVAGNFDSGGYYKGFIRSGNGAHYNGYHFDILVGSIGYGSNSLQFKVQNITPAHAAWVGGCGPTPFGTVDNTIFEHRNNPCGEYLELFITKLGG